MWCSVHFSLDTLKGIADTTVPVGFFSKAIWKGTQVLRLEPGLNVENRRIVKAREWRWHLQLLMSTNFLLMSALDWCQVKIQFSFLLLRVTSRCTSVKERSGKLILWNFDITVTQKFGGCLMFKTDFWLCYVAISLNCHFGSWSRFAFLSGAFC